MNDLTDFFDLFGRHTVSMDHWDPYSPPLTDYTTVEDLYQAFKERMLKEMAAHDPNK